MRKLVIVWILFLCGCGTKTEVFDFERTREDVVRLCEKLPVELDSVKFYLDLIDQQIEAQGPNYSEEKSRLMALSDLLMIAQEKTRKWKEVMHVHDQIMPRIETHVFVYQDKLKKLYSAQPENKLYFQALKDLEIAEVAMFDWMKFFGQNIEPHTPFNQVIELLDKEMQGILLVDSLMNHAINQAESILNNK